MPYGELLMKNTMDITTGHKNNRQESNYRDKYEEVISGEKNILIATADQDSAELIIDELNVEDIRKEIILKKDGSEVIDYFQRTDIDVVKMEHLVDLIILDLKLPEVCGIDVLKFLKKDPTRKAIPVIIFSTSSDAKTISKVYKNGASGFITIPGSFKEFSENIKVLKSCLLNSKNNRNPNKSE